jgi:hypothetical protein
MPGSQIPTPTESSKLHIPKALTESQFAVTGVERYGGLRRRAQGLAEPRDLAVRDEAVGGGDDRADSPADALDRSGLPRVRECERDKT